MSPHRIYIFTSPVHSGKTTTLQQWLRNNNINAAGILTPDKDGKRMLYDIAENQYHEMEMDNACPPEDCLTIGKYRFSKEAFTVAKQILEDAVEKHPDWLIVDEIGKLELKEKTGLEPVVTHIINSYKNGSTNGKLLLVIRNYLLDEAVNAYGLSNDMIINKHFFE
jgi:nucleoside-triphosphatase THEP1